MDNKIIHLGNNTVSFEYENNGINMDNVNVWSTGRMVNNVWPTDRIVNRVSIDEAKDLLEMLQSLIKCQERIKKKNILRKQTEDRIAIRKHKTSVRKARLEYLKRYLPCSEKEKQSKFNKFRKRCEETDE